MTRLNLFSQDTIKKTISIIIAIALVGFLIYGIMAAVLKPKDLSQFKDRMPIKVRWKVVDKLGRQAEGDSVWLLEVKQHEQ